MMVEIAVDLMSIHNFVQIVSALSKEEGVVEELQHPQVLLQLLEFVFTLIGWVMAFVMMSTTMLNAVLMVEIAVDLMSIHNIAHNVNALKEEEKAVGELLRLLEL